MLVDFHCVCIYGHWCWIDFHGVFIDAHEFPVISKVVASMLTDADRHSPRVHQVPLIAIELHRLSLRV